MTRNETPHSLYCNWGHYDELGDNVPLTEALCLEELGCLERWQKELGLRFDYFMVDCLWFDPSEGLLQFRKDRFPKGFEPIRDRILSLGMTPGLWFSTNGLRLEVEAWRDSRSAQGGYSLAEGPYAAALEEGLRHAAENWGARYFKFDFGGFGRQAERSQLSAGESYRRNVESFISIVNGLRRDFPEARFISHTGFFKRNDRMKVGVPDAFESDPAVLGALDRMFSGDPCATDIVTTDMARNSDLFQDHQTWKLHQRGFPLHRIEDHGAVMGKTNTALYRGRHGFHRTWIGQLSRGAQRACLYGNPTCLTRDDAAFLRDSMAIARKAWDLNLPTSIVGPGEPGLSPWHGYMTGGGAHGLLYIVNPTFTPQQIQIQLPGLFAARCLFHDGAAEPPVAVASEILSVELEPEQMAWVGFGDFANESLDWNRQEAPSTAPRLRIVSATFEEDQNGAYRCRLPQPAKELWVFAEARDALPLTGPLHAGPHRFARQDTKDPDATMDPLSHRLVEITGRHKGDAVEPASQIPDKPIWSSISWVGRHFGDQLVDEIQIQQKLDPTRRLRIRLMQAT